MRDTSFHSANKITEDIQTVKEQMNSIQQVQRTVLGAIDENRLVMNQVAYHINQEPPPFHNYQGYSQDTVQYPQPPIGSQPQQANATTQTAAAYQQQIKQLQATIKQLQQQQTSTQPPVFQQQAAWNQAPFNLYSTSLSLCEYDIMR